jgi:hypothetical protein
VPRVRSDLRVVPVTDDELRAALHEVIAKCQEHLRQLDDPGPGGREPMPTGEPPKLTLVSRKVA